MPNEQAARAGIDRLLKAAGWSVQDYKHYNPGAAHGIALREVPLKDGRCDYLLLADRAAIGVIEAKREGTKLSGVADQSALYARNLRLFLQAKAEMRFRYESGNWYVQERGVTEAVNVDKTSSPLGYKV